MKVRQAFGRDGGFHDRVLLLQGSFAIVLHCNAEVPCTATFSLMFLLLVASLCWAAALHVNGRGRTAFCPPPPPRCI